MDEPLAAAALLDELALDEGPMHALLVGGVDVAIAVVKIGSRDWAVTREQFDLLEALHAEGVTALDAILAIRAAIDAARPITESMGEP